MATNLPRPSACLNCGEPVALHFCPRCGQSATDFNTPARNLIAEFLDNYLTFDSRFGRSLRPFLFKPGFLTKEHIAGRRSRYIHPLKLYLFLSCLFFFALTLMGPSTDRRPEPSVAPRGDAAQDSLVASSKAEGRPPRPDNIGGLAAIEHSVIGTGRALIQQLPAEIRPQPQAMAPKRGLAVQQDSLSAPHSPQEVKTKPRRGLFRYQFRENLLSNTPKMMFVLLPLFALVLKGIYRRTDRLYIQHLIFSLYFHAFIFFTLLFATILVYMDFPGSELLADGLAASILLYLFAAMKRVYDQTVWQTLWKCTLLVIFYSGLLAIGLAANIWGTTWAMVI